MNNIVYTLVSFYCGGYEEYGQMLLYGIFDSIDKAHSYFITVEQLDSTYNDDNSYYVIIEYELNNPTIKKFVWQQCREKTTKFE